MPRKSCKPPKVYVKETDDCSGLNYSLIISLLAGVMILIGLFTPWYSISVDCPECEDDTEVIAHLGWDGITYGNQTVEFPEGGQTMINLFWFLGLINGVFILLISFTNKWKRKLALAVSFGIYFLFYSYLFMSVLPKAAADSGIDFTVYPSTGWYLQLFGLILICIAPFIIPKEEYNETD